jgi:hypothetical protein
MERHVEKPVQKFLGLVWAEWSSRVTGSLSALLVLLGLGLSIASAFGVTIPNDALIQTATWILAAACGGQAAYSIWHTESQKVLVLQERFRQKLKLSFSMTDPGCVRPNTKFRLRATSLGRAFDSSSSSFSHIAMAPLEPYTIATTTGAIYSYPDPSDAEGTYYRVKVEADRMVQVVACAGRLETIKKDGQVIVSGEPTTLPFARGEDSDAISKTVHSAAPEYLDFLFITDSNKVMVTAHKGRASSSIDWERLFTEPADYILDIKIVSSEPTAGITLQLKWSGVRATSEIKCLATN